MEVAQVSRLIYIWESLLYFVESKEERNNDGDCNVTVPKLSIHSVDFIVILEIKSNFSDFW